MFHSPLRQWIPKKKNITHSHLIPNVHNILFQSLLHPWLQYKTGRDSFTPDTQYAQRLARVLWIRGSKNSRLGACPFTTDVQCTQSLVPQTCSPVIKTKKRTWPLSSGTHHTQRSVLKSSEQVMSKNKSMKKKGGGGGHAPFTPDTQCTQLRVPEPVI